MQDLVDGGPDPVVGLAQVGHLAHQPAAVVGQAQLPELPLPVRSQFYLSRFNGKNRK